MGMSPKARRRARICAMQALYQWGVTKDLPSRIEAQYKVDNAHFKVDWIFFSEIFLGSVKLVEDLDEKITPVLKQPFKNVHPVEMSILRLATFELMERLDTPFKVVIKEYVDLAQEYGTEEGHTFVNGMLDTLARELRDGM
jgi:N utilization substance protein B